MYWLYSLGLAGFCLACLPGFVARKVWRAGYPLALGERFGFVPLRPGPDRFWVHAVSVGEVMAAAPLVQALQRRWPQIEVVVSTVTGTGARVARSLLPSARASFTFPLDFPGATRRAVGRVRPRCFIGLETELWPNLLRALKRAGVPAVVANGRISDRSYRRYWRVRWLFRPVLDGVTVFAMQSEEDARRIVSLGARPERVVVTGNLKMEAAIGQDGADQRWRRLLGLGAERVWIAGSTHRGEEEAVLDAHAGLRVSAGPLRLILAPRHPERIDEVEALARTRGLRVIRRSRLVAGAAPDVILLDTVGELASLYAVGDAIFVGGSLTAVGGHNVIEPALHGKPVLFGPHMANFRDAAALLLEAGGAIEVRDAAELGRMVERLVRDAAVRHEFGQAAWNAVRIHQGACQRTIAALETLFEPAPARDANGRNASV